jgi:hypothetical protein
MKNNRFILVAVLVILPLSACKMMKTQVFKITYSPTADSQDVRVRTTQGDLLFSARELTAKDQALLRGLRPSECLAVKSPTNAVAEGNAYRFREAQFKRMVQADTACRKVKIPSRITWR